MRSLKPWAVGPFELIEHAETHLKSGGDVDKRMALISYDNAIESSIMTFLKLKPDQRGGFETSNDDRTKWMANFPSKLRFLEHYVATMSGRAMEIGRDEILYFHDLRNQLYHDGNGLVPSELNILGVRRASLWVFDTLFEAESEKLLEDNVVHAVNQKVDKSSLAPSTEFLGAFVELKKSLDSLLPDHQRSASADDLVRLWARALRTISTDDSNEYVDVLREADRVHDAFLEGRAPDSDSKELGQLSEKLEGASVRVREALREHQSRISELALQATEEAIAPEGNKKAGIVYQSAGTGLTISVAAYVSRALCSPLMSGYRFVIVTDRQDVVFQTFEALLYWLPEEGIKVATVMNANETDGLLKNNNVIVTTSQRLVRSQVTCDEPLLFIGMNLNESHQISCELLEKSARILFTSTPLISKLSRIFGETIVKYGVEQAVAEGLTVPVLVQAPDVDQQLFGSDHTQYLAQHVANHFGDHRHKGGGKGIVITPDLHHAQAFVQQILALKSPVMSFNTENIAVFSAQLGRSEMARLATCYTSNDQSLFLLVGTEASLCGFDAPCTDVLYVLASLTSPQRERLRGLLARSGPGKYVAYVIDYLKQEWNE